MEKEKRCLDIIRKMEKVSNILSSYSQCQREYYKNSGVYFEKEVHLLKKIIENPKVTITEIAKQSERTKSSVSQILKRLVEKKLLIIEKDKLDKRKMLFIPTEQGKKLYVAHEEYDNKMAGFLAEIYKENSIKEIDLFLEMLSLYEKYVKTGYSLKDIEKNK